MCERERERERERDSFRPLALMKECRLMTYYLTVRTIIMQKQQQQGNQQTNDNVLELGT